MKKTFTLLACAAFATAGIAQDLSNKIVVKSTHTLERSENALKVEVDTAGLAVNSVFSPTFAPGGQAVNYGYLGGGFIFGNNVDGYDESAQGYFNYDELNFDIDEVLIMLAGKITDGGGTTGDATVSIMSMADNKAANDDGNGGAALNSLGPDAVLGTATVAYTALDSTFGALSSVTFSPAVSVSGTHFAVSFDASDFSVEGDSLGVLGDQDGEGQEMAFHYVNGNWYVTNFAFGGSLDANIALFPVINDWNVGIDGEEFLNGVQMSAYPNPAQSNVSIAFNTNKEFNNLTLEVFDLTGRKLMTEKFQDLVAGKVVKELNVSNLESGKYYYSVIADGQRITKSFVVAK